MTQNEFLTSEVQNQCFRCFSTLSAVLELNKRIATNSKKSEMAIALNGIESEMSDILKILDREYTPRESRVEAINHMLKASSNISRTTPTKLNNEN